MLKAAWQLLCTGCAGYKLTFFFLFLFCQMEEVKKEKERKTIAVFLVYKHVDDVELDEVCSEYRKQ